MRPRLPACASALVLAATSCVLLTAQPAAAEDPVFPGPEISTLLPAGSFTDLAVDDAHQQAFIALKEPSALVVAGLDGSIRRTVTGLNNPSDLTVSPDGSTLYVIEERAKTLALVDTRTYTVSRVALPADHCPVAGTFTGGKLWYSYRFCAQAYDPATGTSGGTPFRSEPGEIRALPDRPDRLFQMGETSTGGLFHVYDVSGETPVEVAGGGKGRPFCDDAALIGGGEQVVVAGCSIEDGHLVYNTADLTEAARIPYHDIATALAVSADGRFLADVGDGYSHPYGSRVHIAEIAEGSPGTPVREYGYEFYTEVVPEGVSFTAGGDLLAVTEDWAADRRLSLHVFQRATRFDSSITLNVPGGVDFRGTVAATGTLNKGPGPTTLTLSRKDRTGTHDMGTVPVAADGTFAFSHTPGLTGPVTYTLAYAGDDAHQAATLSRTVFMRPLPFDVNADGYAETVVGAPGENLGDDTDTGQLHVLPGTASGTTGSGSKAYHQDTAGVPGDNEDGDGFASTTASGDFNGDGYADVAVSAPKENLGSTRDAGEVFVFYGSASGLRTNGVSGLYPTTSNSKDMLFGYALAVGDFDGDGRDDLAAAGPGRYSGELWVYPGSSSGLSRTRSSHFVQGENGMPGEAHSYDLFGYALAAGDVNGDTRDELAIGEVYDWEDKDWSTGSVTVMYGTAKGLSVEGAQRLSKETPGVPGGAASFNEDKGDVSDQFGNSVALADFSGDGRADLAVAAAGAPVTVDGVRKADAGTVTILYSNGSRIATTGAVQLTQSTGGIPGGPGANDFFGATITAGDANNDGRAELVVYSPGDDLVTIIPGATGGLNFAGSRFVTQETPGIPGGTESEDGWGYSLRFADVKGSGFLALLVGADGENSGRGTVTVLPGTASGPSGSGARLFDQDSPGVPGSAENGDHFGSFF
ncbi:integrin alpha [Phytomonospora endophytica]|uniref:Uncharacterized protein n=1 Tax=Phytomonospora endophytica TaxID=714109 RepID=A0A841FFQ9_9ACTN|nr:FG-GAP repeat protein [Phytomonospora endophytica]MBB6036161.1 hypothetical protein [Phytomonospora endophytica]GIG67065.1 hypothetical protein Pen01_33600 [Phytomonospora endophytica]